MGMYICIHLYMYIYVYIYIYMTRSLRDLGDSYRRGRQSHDVDVILLFEVLRAAWVMGALWITVALRFTEGPLIQFNGAGSGECKSRAQGRWCGDVERASSAGILLSLVLLASLPAHLDPLRLGDVIGKDRQRRVVCRTFSNGDGELIPKLYGVVRRESRD